MLTLDHLTVVQDDFGDAMRMGDGDEVEAVVHPVAPGSERVYDFQLVDSLSLRYAGGEEEIRVYQVRVRPRDFEEPGFVGTIYLDRASAAIVRMSFSFTPASYVDPYLDYIRVSLDNSLWLGRHWLPYRQEVEIRREIPVLAMLTAGPDTLEARAHAIAADAPGQFAATTRSGWSSPGGGSFPAAQLATTLVALDPGQVGAHALALRLRLGDPAIVARVEDERVLLDPRTIRPRDDGTVLVALHTAAAELQEAEGKLP